MPKISSRPYVNNEASVFVVKAFNVVSKEYCFQNITLDTIGAIVFHFVQLSLINVA